MPNHFIFPPPRPLHVRQREHLAQRDWRAID